MSKQPPPYPTTFEPKARSTHPLLGHSLGYPAGTDQDVKPPTFLDTGLAWIRAAPGARRKENLVATSWSRFRLLVLSDQVEMNIDIYRCRKLFRFWNILTVHYKYEIRYKTHLLMNSLFRRINIKKCASLHHARNQNMCVVL